MLESYWGHIRPKLVLKCRFLASFSDRISKFLMMLKVDYLLILYRLVSGQSVDYMSSVVELSRVQVVCVPWVPCRLRSGHPSQGSSMVREVRFCFFHLAGFVARFMRP